MRTSKIKKSAALALMGAMSAWAFTVSASDTPGQAGQTKVNIYDNTHNGWNVATNDPDTGGADAAIGFVNFHPTVPGQPNQVMFVVAGESLAPNCTFDVQLVLLGSDPDSGLAPDGTHTGFINIIGTLTTNKHGKGNTGAIKVDVTTLVGSAISGGTTYAHVDLEDPSGECREADGTAVVNNEYGASGEMPGQGLGLPSNIHWVQP